MKLYSLNGVAFNRESEHDSFALLTIRDGFRMIG